MGHECEFMGNTLFYKEGDDIVEIDPPTALGLSEWGDFSKTGFRLYKDGVAPEFATPECRDARKLITHIKAGERILTKLCLSIKDPNKRPLLSTLSYNYPRETRGSHENYLVSRGIPIEKIIEYLTSFLVSRVPLVGPGGYIHDPGSGTRYVIDPRAHRINEEFSLSTLSNRAIINTRDETLGDSTKFRRLHLIISGCNMSEYSWYMRFGPTAIILKMLEHDHPLPMERIALASPVGALHAISSDLTCKSTVALANEGHSTTAIQIQREYYMAAQNFFNAHSDIYTTRDINVMEWWKHFLDKLEKDPLLTKRHLDWTQKYALLDGYAKKNRSEKTLEEIKTNQKVFAIKYHLIQPFIDEHGNYSSCGPGETDSLYYHCISNKKHSMDRFIEDSEIEYALKNPPRDTRAYLRGKLIEYFSENKRPNDLLMVDWNYVKREDCRIDLDDPGETLPEGMDIKTYIEKNRTIIPTYPLQPI